jgi:hypothetical protein
LLVRIEVRRKVEDTKGLTRSSKSKIPKGSSKAVNPRMTDNMYGGRKKRNKRAHKTLHRKLRNLQHEPHENREWTHVLWHGKQSLLH